jgi:hypothetical protein
MSVRIGENGRPVLSGDVAWLGYERNATSKQCLVDLANIVDGPDDFHRTWFLAKRAAERLAQRQSHRPASRNAKPGIRDFSVKPSVSV